MSDSGIGLVLCGLGARHCEMGGGRVEEDDAVVWRFSSEIWGSRACSCALLPPASSFLISRVGVRQISSGDFGDLRPHF